MKTLEVLNDNNEYSKSSINNIEVSSNIKNHKISANDKNSKNIKLIKL